jgi:hypothetical protein
MFKIFSYLTKSAVGVVCELPIAVVSDVVTMGGAMTDKDKPYTATAMEKIVENVQEATKP